LTLVEERMNSAKAGVAIAASAVPRISARIYPPSSFASLRGSDHSDGAATSHAAFTT
jgi:hypothetical protein